MAKTFREWDVDQSVLFPPNVMDLVPEGHVALDGTKMQANASRHKAMSYGRMKKAETRQVGCSPSPRRRTTWSEYEK